MIEGLSGPMGPVGTNQFKSWQYVAAHLNAKENPAGVKFEIVPMDSKSSPQEALNLLKAAVVQRRFLHLLGLQRPGGAVGRNGQVQIHRPGEGGQGAGGSAL